MGSSINVRKSAVTVQQTYCAFCRRNLLVILTVFGVLLGLATGFGVREARPSDDVIMCLGLPGELYMRMLKMMILPLVIATVITGTASLNPRSQGRISLVAVTYIVISNSISPIIGTAMVLIINPAKYVKKLGNDSSASKTVMQTQDIFADLIRNLFPDNVITAAFRQSITKYEREVVNDVRTNASVPLMTRYVGHTDGTNVLGLLIVCSLFGLATSAVGKYGKAFQDFFLAACEIILRILQWLVWFTPVGVFSLVATILAQTPNIAETFHSLGMFILASVLGIAILVYGFVYLVYLIVTRKNPCTFFLNMLRPHVVAIAAASSAIAIPDILYFMENRNNIDKRISRFVVPLSSAVNKPASALYIAASCVFVCQLEDLPTDASKVLVIIILSALSTFAVPSVPSASIVTLLVILTAMNVPSKTVGLLLTVEWFLDRCRTAGNVHSMNLCVAVTQRFANLPPTINTEDGGDDVPLQIVIEDGCEKTLFSSPEMETDIV